MKFPKPTRPAELPELRAQLVDDPTLWEAVNVITSMLGDTAAAEALRDSLSRASLWWIGTDCCDLLDHVAPSMPPVDLDVELVPDLDGFVYLERPMAGSSGMTADASVSFDCVQWVPGIVEGLVSLSIIVWRLNPDEGTVLPAGMGWMPVPRGRSDWPFGFATDQRNPGVTDLVHQSVLEDRRLIAALWQLTAQHKITDITDVHPDRAARRRLERRGHEPAPVRLISLNRKQRGPSTTGSSDREYSCQWIVRPHWRQQPYGPGRTLRKAVLIDQHIKGPEDKPLRVRDAVKVWDQQ